MLKMKKMQLIKSWTDEVKIKDYFAKLEKNNFCLN